MFLTFQSVKQVQANFLQFVFFVVGLQVVFDLATPEVSFIGHVAGLILGFLMGVFLVSSGHSKNGVSQALD